MVLARLLIALGSGQCKFWVHWGPHGSGRDRFWPSEGQELRFWPSEECPSTLVGRCGRLCPTTQFWLAWGTPVQAGGVTEFQNLVKNAVA